MPTTESPSPASTIEQLFTLSAVTIDPQFKRVGYLEYVDEDGRPHYEYNCLYGCVMCVHTRCRWAALRDAGFADVAAKLEANYEAKDWAGNWGKMVYEKDRHGRNAERRKLMADIIREMRKGAVSYGDACVGGAWAGALMTINTGNT